MSEPPIVLAIEKIEPMDVGTTLLAERLRAGLLSAAFPSSGPHAWRPSPVWTIAWVEQVDVEPEPMSYEEYVRVTREQEAADRRRFTGSE